MSGVSVAAPAPVSPERLLGAADRMMCSGGGDEWLAGHWPRTCAVLIRLALEAVLDEYWGRTEPSAGGCSMRAQLLLLPRFAGEESALLARESWLGLSRAAHHHAYELAPTAGELRGWHSDVGELMERLTPPAPDGVGGQ